MKLRPTLLALLAAALALPGCGGGKSRDIPPDQAANLNTRLSQVERRSDAGACGALENSTFSDLDNALANLPRRMNSDLRSALKDGIRDLKSMAVSECQERRLTKQTETETTTTETEPTETETTPTEPEPVQTITETQPPKEPKKPKTEPPTEDQGTGGSGPPGQEKKGKGD